MKKNELKNDMIVELSNGDKRLVVDDNLFGNNGFDHLSNYDDDLKNTLYGVLDIIKVYKYKFARSFYSILDYDNLNLIWERKEVKLTDREIEILKALKTLGYEFLARDKDTELCAYNEKPYKEKYCWMVYGRNYISVNNNVLEIIKWEDEEPKNIDDLLKGV